MSLVVNNISNDLFFEIFNFISEDSLCKFGSVNKKLNRLAGVFHEKVLCKRLNQYAVTLSPWVGKASSVVDAKSLMDKKKNFRDLLKWACMPTVKNLCLKEPFLRKICLEIDTETFLKGSFVFFISKESFFLEKIESFVRLLRWHSGTSEDREKVLISISCKKWVHEKKEQFLSLLPYAFPFDIEKLSRIDSVFKIFYPNPKPSFNEILKK